MENVVENIKNVPSGIGGWLIVVIISLIFYIILSILYVFNEIFPLFEPEMWKIFTSSEGAFYHPLFSTIIFLELIFNISRAIFIIILLILMFIKNYRFPKLMLIYLIAYLVLETTLRSMKYSFSISVFTDRHNELKEEFIRLNLFMVIYFAIWISYFIVSKRVKNTFV